jgi:hypothetical protein
MKKLFLFSLLMVAVLFSVAQKRESINIFLQGQGSFIAYDRFKGFTGGGLGGGVQLVLTPKKKFKLQIDAAATLFSINKILFIYENGDEGGPKQSVATIFAGFIYEPLNRFEVAFSAGPAFHDYGTGLGIKPYAAFYLGKKKIVKVHTSLTHIFSTNLYSKRNTGIINAGLAVKLF